MMKIICSVSLFFTFGKMNNTYLILGGNKGDKLQNLQTALQLIESTIGKIILKSDVFVTAAWGNANQPDFVNQAICVETIFSATDLLETILNIEKQLGRIRTEEKWQERTMDIDILFFNNEIINTLHLKVPHPHLQKRNFVLVPMAQIASDLEHPVFKKSISTLLQECSDELKVIKQ